MADLTDTQKIEKISRIERDLELKFGAYCLDDAAERRAVAEYVLQAIIVAYDTGHDDGYGDGYGDG